MELLGSVLPESTNQMAFQTINDIVNNPRGGLLSVGFILAFYFSTNGMSALIEAFNSSYHIRESRSFIYQKNITNFNINISMSSNINYYNNNFQ